MKFKLILISLITIFCINAKSQSTYKKFIDSISATIFSLGKKSVSVTLTNDNTNTSIPNSGILISKPFLDQLYASKGTETAEKVLVFVLSHEYAHQLQFEKYQSDLISTSSCEKKMLLETQADIIAGFFYSEVLGLNKSTSIQNTSLQILIFQEVYNLGNKEFALGSHPSFKQRRSAFRLGLAFDLLRNSKIYAANDAVKSTMDVSEDEDIYTWSLKIAKRINHYPLSVLQNILILKQNYRDEDVRFDTSRINPFVSYRDTIKNIGSKKIAFFAQYKVIGVDRQNDDESALQLQGPTNSHKIVLSPGETAVIEGTLNWSSVARDKFMPKLLGLPDNNILYNAEYIDDSPIQFDQLCENTDQYALEDLFSRKRTLSESILYASRYARFNFQSFCTNLGELTSDFLTYHSSYYIPFSKDVEINKYLYDSTFSLDIEFYSGSDSIQADSSFSIVKDAIRFLGIKKFAIIEREYSDYLNEHNSDESDLRKEYQYSKVDTDILKTVYPKRNESELSMEGAIADNKTDFELRFSCHNKTKYYSINLTLKFKK